MLKTVVKTVQFVDVLRQFTLEMFASTLSPKLSPPQLERQFNKRNQCSAHTSVYFWSPVTVRILSKTDTCCARQLAVLTPLTLTITPSALNITLSNLTLPSPLLSCPRPYPILMPSLLFPRPRPRPYSHALPLYSHALALILMPSPLFSCPRPYSHALALILDLILDLILTLSTLFSCPRPYSHALDATFTCFWCSSSSRSFCCCSRRSFGVRGLRCLCFCFLSEPSASVPARYD